MDPIASALLFVQFILRLVSPACFECLHLLVSEIVDRINLVFTLPPILGLHITVL
jgi:hypothetical protein